jgi:NuA3 HAT complex component NTO1
MRYNKPGTPYYKAAQRIQTNSATVLAELDNLRTSAPSELIEHNEMMANSLVQPNIITIGDLEPPLALLELLVSLDIADELNIVLRSKPLQFLLAYELPEVRHPPRASVPLAPPPRKTKRERKAESAKRRAEQRAAMAPPAALDTMADSEMADASFGSLISMGFPAKLAAAADAFLAETRTTPTLPSSDLEDGSVAEQVLGKRKRAKSGPPHVSTNTEVLTDINPKASFALFDKGWILDPGVRRGGRARVERIPLPLTKKQSRGTYDCRKSLVHIEK